MSVTIETIAGQQSTLRFSNASSTTEISAVSTDFTHIDAISIDNTGNTHDVWLKVFNVTGPTLGSVDPYLRIKCPLQEKRLFTFKALQFNPLSWVVTKEANYSKNTDPDNGVGVIILAH
jgi:hypothetical protein